MASTIAVKISFMVILRVETLRSGRHFDRPNRDRKLLTTARTNPTHAPNTSDQHSPSASAAVEDIGAGVNSGMNACVTGMAVKVPSQQATKMMPSERAPVAALWTSPSLPQQQFLQHSSVMTILASCKEGIAQATPRYALPIPSHGETLATCAGSSLMEVKCATMLN